MLDNIQKSKIKKALQNKYLFLFILWIFIFTFINFYFNEVIELGLGFIDYSWWISIPYIFFLIANTLMIALSVNLIILKVKEVKSLNPKAGFFSILGTSFALLTGACPGCIAGIFPAFMGIFGSNISLYGLPMHGAELQILSFIFLIIGIYYLSLDMSCKLKINKPKMEKTKSNKKLIAIIIMSFIATINAAYLTYNAYILKASQESFDLLGQNLQVIAFACDFNSTFSCSSVFTHDFAWIFGIPFSLIALIVYPIILLIAFLAIKNKIKNAYKILLTMVIGGIIFNGYIIVNEYFVGVYCFLCLICTLIIIAIGGISIAGLKENNTK